MGQSLSLPIRLINITTSYYKGFLHYLIGSGRNQRYVPYPNKGDNAVAAGDSSNEFIPPCSYLNPSSDDTDDQLLFKQHARIHLYSLALTFYLYNKPHYRKGSYRDDLIDNLRNVAIPGTGIALSLLARSRLFGFAFLMTGYPMICCVASVHKWLSSRFTSSISEEYKTRLLAPDDWFTYWRLNCNLVGLHSLVNKMPAGYEMENKWHFLEEGEKRGVPISPFLHTPGIVVKHRNEEGGMGIYFYHNATDGGDWIIQERIQNSDWVSQMLPPKAPLSTFRVITQSRASIDLSKKPKVEDITALSCVFRAGRANADTDHDSILFNVDPQTGLVKKGTTNAHWYRLGLRQTLPGMCPWRSHHSYTHHPDGNIPVSNVHTVPDIEKMLHLVEESHYKLCPDVPLAGWDVVLSADSKLPVCLLEVNLSCNFFRGQFDKKTYLDFIDDLLMKLQSQRLTADF